MFALVFSDSHGETAAMKTEVMKYKGSLDYIIHAGDLLHDVEVLRKFVAENGIVCEILAVPGNGDFYHADEPQEMMIEIEGKKIFLLHGHTRNVTITPTVIKLTAEKKNADIVIFGHTHIAEEYFYNDILFFNPGSIYRSRDRKHKSYGILEIKNGKIITDFMFL